MLLTLGKLQVHILDNYHYPKLTNLKHKTKLTDLKS